MFDQEEEEMDEIINEKNIYWLDEIGEEYNDIVGKKSANLGEALKVNGIHIPSGFTISISACKEFINKTGIDEEIQQYFKKNFNEPIGIDQLENISQALRNIVESKEMPPDLKDSIAKYYRSLCEKYESTDIGVSVRSAGTESHPGQYDTFLNVKGVEQVLQKVIKVWSSIFNTRSLSFVILNALPIDKCPPIGVCVLGMVQARSAGVCLTVHPGTGDETQALIESNWGLGESVIGGIVSPDRYIVDRIERQVIEKVPGQKLKQVVMINDGVVEERVSTNMRKKFSLSDEEVIGILELAEKMEAHFGVPQDVEWAIDESLPVDSNVVLLQTRPQISIPKKKTNTDKIIDKMLRGFRIII